MSFRLATPEDAPAIAALVGNAFDPALRPYILYALPRVDAFIRLIAAFPHQFPDRMLAVFEDTDGIVRAFAETRAPGNGAIVLSYVCVDPSMRRRGLAAGALQWLLDRHDDIDRVELDVFASNAAALALYRKLGFSDVAQDVWQARDMPPASPESSPIIIDGFQSGMASLQSFGFGEFFVDWAGRSRRLGRMDDTVLRCFDAEDFADDGLLIAMRTAFPDLNEVLLIGSAQAQDLGKPDDARVVNRSIRMVRSLARGERLVTGAPC